MNQIAPIQKRSLVDSMAARYDMEPTAFVAAIKATVIKGECSNEQFAAFLMVAKEYDLNPLTKEIYAFPDRGGIQPIVSIDGWMNLINSHPQFDGMEFVDTHDDGGKLYSVECRMFRKDRQRHTSVIEYMSECFRQTDPWKKWPNRMLRHKAAIQCARYAFGFSGIMEPDEYERMKDVTPVDDKPSIMERLSQAKQTQGTQEGFDAASVTRETDTLTSGQQTEQNTETSDVPHASDAGSNTDLLPGDASTTEPGGSSESSPDQSSGSEQSDESDHDFDEVEWLKSFAKRVMAAIGADIDQLNDVISAELVSDLSEDTESRAGAIVRLAQTACADLENKSRYVQMIAGKAKVEEKDLA